MALQAFIEVFSRISWDSNISSLLLLSLNASIFLSLWPGCYNFCCSSCQELPIDLSFMYSWWRFYQTTQTKRDVYKTKKSLDVPQSIAYTHTSLSLIYHEASLLMHYFYHERMKIWGFFNLTKHVPVLRRAITFYKYLYFTTFHFFIFFRSNSLRMSER